MLITSLDNEKVNHLKKLDNKKYRDECGEFLVEGSHLVLEAFKAGILKELFLEKEEVFPLNVPTTYVTNEIIEKITSLEVHSNILGLCNKLDEEIDVGNKVLVLDNVQDPGNLGTILRSAVAFGVDTVILGDDTVDMYNTKVIRAAQGMMFHVNIIRKNLLEYLPILKDSGYKVYGTRVTHGNKLKTIGTLDKYILIMGNEGNGISEYLEEICDEFIYIDMMSECESLNVGVAASIILYQINE